MGGECGGMPAVECRAIRSTGVRVSTLGIGAATLGAVYGAIEARSSYVASAKVLALSSKAVSTSTLRSRSPTVIARGTC